MLTVVCAAMLVGTLSAAAQQLSASSGLPHLQKNGHATQLMVDGKPLLVLGGEVRSSDSSSVDYMKPIWPELAAAHLNTVLAPVTWQQIEPEEGRFDFTVLDALLRDARSNNLRLVLLWFGSWKNGVSSYTPVWVEKDPARFPLVQNSSGQFLGVLSTFSETNREADARAFAALLRHLREVDSAQHTVLLLQVENEVGVISDSRDHCAAANQAFGQPVPQELMDYLAAHKDALLPEFRKVWEDAGAKVSGTWQEVFGPGPATDEIFMAWNYARYINRVASAGKTELPLPMYINTALVKPQDKLPGDYPSGGAVAQVHDVWQAGAPNIDILAPDIYFPDFPGLLNRYSRNGNPPWVPESVGGPAGAANFFFGTGFGSIGYSPYAIEEQDDPNGPLAKAYDFVSQMAPMILDHQASGSIAGVWLSADRPTQDIALGGYTLHFALRVTRKSTVLPDRGYGFVFQSAPDEFVIAGTDIQVTFTPDTPGPPVVGLSKVEEGTFRQGQWVAGRWLNGDDTQLLYDLTALAAQNLSGEGVSFPAGDPTIRRVQLYRYP
jgi:beta-galactosidase GanA